MMEYRASHKEAGGSQTVLRSGLDAMDAHELRRILMEAIEKSSSVTLEVEPTHTVSYSCIQVLCSACMSAARQGVDFEIKGEGMEQLLVSASVAGFPSKQCKCVDTMKCCLAPQYAGAAAGPTERERA